jgi:hypothetical protein
MRGGLCLHATFTSAGTAWALSDGTVVHNKIATAIINSPDVVSCGDGLFDGVVAQTYRHAEP